ncbi:hypothetical protein [Lactococcus lactis]|uniref:hypothetical protein n=1 Tax=Lactococcus lactis TaxID=1358 RepID=UPI0019146A44|nr:hypothetical protein [Lactococcus lactis]
MKNSLKMNIKLLLALIFWLIAIIGFILNGVLLLVAPTMLTPVKENVLFFVWLSSAVAGVYLLPEIYKVSESHDTKNSKYNQ